VPLCEYLPNDCDKYVKNVKIKLDIQNINTIIPVDFDHIALLSHQEAR